MDYNRIGSLLKWLIVVCLKRALTFIQSWRVMILLILVLPFSAMLFYWCHTTNSLGKEEETLVLVGSWLHEQLCMVTSNLVLGSLLCPNSSGRRGEPGNEGMVLYCVLWLFNVMCFVS